MRSFVTSRNVAILLFLLTVAASIQKYFQHNINNYFIFTRSFALLVSRQNLYGDYPALFNDKFLYSPTFAFTMATFYFLPDLAGVILWNLLNAALFFFALRAFAGDEKNFLLIFAIAFVELFNALQNNQSNPLVTALILFTFVNFEKRKVSNAAAFAAALLFIKIYGFATIIFAAFYPGKSRFLRWLIFWFAVLLVLPLIAVSIQELSWQYQNWFEMIRGFKTGSQLSVMGFIERITALKIIYPPVQIAGLLITLTPLIYTKNFADLLFRRKFLASLMIFLVIFNQSAESPTYVTAVTGAAIWFSDSRKTIGDYFLIGLVLVFTSLASTSIFPSTWRHGFFEEFGIKVIPCLLVWLKIQYELHTQSFSTPIKQENIKELI